MRVAFTPLAEADLEEIADYIARANPGRALSFITDLRMQCDRIGKNPGAYRRRPELGKDLHSAVFRNYVLFFEAGPSEVTIIRILHAARDLSKAFLPKP